MKKLSDDLQKFADQLRVIRGNNWCSVFLGVSTMNVILSSATGRAGRCILGMEPLKLEGCIYRL